jgi:hypothetical protein
VKAGVFYEQELIYREIGGEKPVLELLEPVRRIFRQVGW